MGPQPYQDAYHPDRNYGNSNFDIRSAFKGYVVYQLPFGKGKKFLNNGRLLDEIAGGWQFSGTVVLSTGNPFTVTSNQIVFNNGGGALYPNWSGLSPHVPHRSIHEWFNPAAFQRPADGQYGNVARNALYGPGVELTTMSVKKEFTLAEALSHTFKLQLRLDADNALNHPSFGVPNTTLGGDSGPGTNYSQSGTGKQTGVINSTIVGGRKVQVAAHITF
jgi:hypothetical protein